MYPVSESHKAYLIPIKDIFIDESFNCRRPFTDASVLELSQEIALTKLNYPVTVQPGQDVLHGIPAPFKVRLIAGFRRLAAHRLLGREVIEAYIEEGLSEEEARRYNYKENIERKELSMSEEATGMRTLYPKGTAVGKIATELKRSVGWVQARLCYLDADPAIREAYDNDEIKQGDLIKIARLPPDGQLQALLKLRTVREIHDKPKRVSMRSMESCRERSKREIEKRLIDMATRIGDGPWTAALGWAAGNISDEALDFVIDNWDVSDIMDE